MPPNVREIIKMLELDGWRKVTTRGSHRKYKHPYKPGAVTVPGHMRDQLPPGTIASILKQARIKRGGR